MCNTCQQNHNTFGSVKVESGSWYAKVCKPVAIECHMCFNAAQSAANNLEYFFCRLVERHRIFVIASHLRIGPNQRRLQRPFFKPAMKRFCGSAQRPAHHSFGSSAQRPAHHSSNVKSMTAPLAAHNLARSAQQLAVLQCLDRGGWLVTPLLNGCRVAVLSRAYKQALEGWPNRLECLELLHREVKIYSVREVARKLQWVAHHCAQLRYLVLDTTLPDGGNISEAIQAVARGCSRLRHLDLAGNSVSETAIETVAQACPHLECLLMCDCDVTSAALWAVAQHCPQLKQLDVSFNRVSDAAIETVAQACPQLERLCVANSDVNRALWAVAQGCRQLKELDVSHNLVSNAAIQAVAQAYPQLKSLNVSYCCCLRDEAIDSVALGCPQLECLDVSGLQDITDAAIHAVAQGCPQLKELDMTQCARLTESAIVSIARGCTHLEWLKHDNDFMHGMLTSNGLLTHLQHRIIIPTPQCNARTR